MENGQDLNISKEDLLAAYRKIFDKSREVALLTVDKKAVIDSMKEKVAQKENLEDKNGKPDIKKVKGALLGKSLEVFLTGKNTLEEDLSTMENYLTYIKNKDIPKSQVDRFNIISKDLKDTNSELNGIVKDLKSTIEPQILNAIKAIVKSELESELQKTTDSGDEEKKGSKEAAVLEKFYSMVGKLKKIIKGK